MKVDSLLAQKLATNEFIVTAECAPGATASAPAVEAAVRALGGKPVAVNLPDNQHGTAISSWAAAVIALKAGVVPILQMVTRDRNRLALQADLLGAASLGIRQVLCLSGYHQTLTGCPESANVFDIDSTQWIEIAARLSEKGVMADGTPLAEPLGMLVGAVANPFLKPLELNVFRLAKKIEAGARFIQTHAVFDVAVFRDWFEAVRQEGLTEKAAVLASVYPLESVEEARRLRDTLAEFCISDEIVGRLKAAGDAAAQKKAGLAIGVETIKALKGVTGLRGVHLLSGGKEKWVPEILAAAGL
jgi:methylenetetrahydrofolate reductase (NADPH)